MREPQANTAARAVHARLRADIVRGVLSAGEKLRIGDLAARYGCGAIPLREALNRLAGEGLVIHSQQKGFAVAPISLADLADLTRARSLISEAAMREAVLRGDADWEERVVLAHHRLAKIPRYLSVESRVPNPEYDHLHREFHSALFSGCQSARLVEVADDLFDHAERHRNLSRRVAFVPREDEHTQLMRAALERNVAEAVRLMKHHVEFTYEIVAQGGATGPDHGSG